MTLALDQNFDVDLSGGTAGDPYTFAHTPDGTLRGCVAILRANTPLDKVEGVDIGGAELAEVAGSPLVGGVSSIHVFFLGSGIPSGDQTVTFDLDVGVSGAAVSAGFFGIQAATDTEIEDISTVAETTTADPSISLVTSVPTIPIAMLESGHNLKSALSMPGPYEDYENEFSSTTCVWAVPEFPYDEIAAGTIDFDWTATSEEAMLFALAIREVGSGGGAVPGGLGLHGALELSGLILPVRRQDGRQYHEYGIIRPYRNRHRPHVIGRKRVPDD